MGVFRVLFDIGRKTAGEKRQGKKPISTALVREITSLLKPPLRHTLFNSSPELQADTPTRFVADTLSQVNAPKLY